jgi:ubiquinone/menaquinone biosynthesis C-methylase UbiE
MSEVAAGRNIDPRTVAGFGEEWDSFDQMHLDAAEWTDLFERYFSIFPWNRLPEMAEGFDLGCGSGRWAAGVAPRVGTLNCIDPSEKALTVTRRRLQNQANARFHCASVDTIPLADASQDFGYSLGVLHHIPDTAAALRDCAAKLKPGAPFLIYLYYAFDNRPLWFRGLWHLSDVARRVICHWPFGLRKAATTTIAALVYWPLARLALLLEKAGMDVAGLPLSPYRNNSFYTMRTDALDRLGTRLEQRFTRAQIEEMMSAAGLTDILFSEEVPYWVAVGTKAAQAD